MDELEKKATSRLIELIREDTDEVSDNYRDEIIDKLEKAQNMKGVAYILLDYNLAYHFATTFKPCPTVKQCFFSWRDHREDELAKPYATQFNPLMAMFKNIGRNINESAIDPSELDEVESMEDLIPIMSKLLGVDSSVLETHGIENVMDGFCAALAGAIDQLPSPNQTQVLNMELELAEDGNKKLWDDIVYYWKQMFNNNGE